MQALILAGGEGMRLRPLTLNIPKPIVPVGNQPFLLRQIELLKRAGITDITLSLSYQPSAIEKVLGDGSEFGVRLRYLIEPAPLGTAGAYKFAEQFLDASTIVLNGDILTDIDLEAVVRHHENTQALATIVLSEVADPTAYGLVQVGDKTEVLNFLEKPKSVEFNNLKTINAGIYVFEPSVLDFIPKNEKYSFEYQLFPDFLRKKENFKAFIARDNYWLDIGTPERYLQAHHDLTAGKYKNSQIGKDKNFDLSASNEIDDKSMVAKRCRIKPGARIINSILGDDVIIEEAVRIENSVIWAGTRIGSNAIIDGSIIGFDCRIGKNVSISRGSILGDKTIISDYSFC